MRPEHFDLVVDRTLRSAMRMHSDLQRYNLQNSRGELSLKQLASNRKRAKETMRVAIRAALNECALLSAARKP